MGWSFKIGRIFGIDMKVHFTFALILVWGAMNYGGSAGPLYGVLVTLSLFTLVLLHELGHSMAARYYGIPTKDITLLPIGGVARLEKMPGKPIQELVVALAGPAVNVVIALFLLPVVAMFYFAQSTAFSFGSLAQPGVPGLLTFLLSANIMLVIFNMIPAFPLDGGRVFRATVALFTDYNKATKIAVQVGRVFAVGLGLFGIFTGQIFMALIAFFIFMAGGQEGQAVAVRSALKGVQARHALSGNSAALSPHATVGQVASMMLTNPQPHFAVLDPLSGEFLGVATGQNVSAAMQQGLWHRRITDIMHHAHNIPRIALNTSLMEAQDKLAATSSQVVAVYDDLHFKGVITANDIYRIFRLMSQSGPAGQRVMP